MDVISVRFNSRLYNYKPTTIDSSVQNLNPCGGAVEHLHRDPASCRRRRKGKSKIGDNKIWSRVPRDAEPRKTALARASSIYKIETRPLVRGDAPQKQDRNSQTVNK
jgi:hypothetical protein